MTEEKIKDILRKRAEKISGEEVEVNKQSIEIVEFTLADEHYAIESYYIREVYPYKNFTSLPCTPPFVKGIINVRRKIISVIDLRVLFNLPILAERESNKVIILELDDKEFAIMTDTIIGVRSITQEEIQGALPTLTGVRQDFLKGITSEQLIILDGQKLLKNKQMVVEEHV